MEENKGVSSIDDKLLAIDEKLAQVLQHLTLMSTSVNFSKFRKKTTGIEYSKFCSTLAFVLCSLKHVQLKLQGQNMKNHQVSTYLNKIKSYMKQIIDLQNKESQRRPRVDRTVAKRIIKMSTRK